ncbi:MAG TPA: dipeptidase [Longimicrobiales bacterium]|nr:dipeptidase [Longimicrobiales bacterium]
MPDPLSYIDRESERFREELFEFLRIPSISARSEHDADTRRAAEWLLTHLRNAGVDAALAETPRHPAVIARWTDAPHAPTVLVYGHYDVQPAEPLDEWSSAPFEPEVRDGRIRARGAADDKSQVFLQVKALEALLATRGTLPLNVTLVLEGEEEIGSPDLVPLIQARRHELAADHVVISDSMMFGPGQPSLIFAMRGLAYFELDAEIGSHDLHSGQYGGAVANPANALAAVIASMHDAVGHVAVPGFYDDVAPVDDTLRARFRALPFDDAAYQRSAGGAEPVGEAGYTTVERLWTRPTLDVNGLVSGYTGEGAKTVLPARARAKLSCRLVAGQDPARVGERLRAHVERVTPPGVRITVRQIQAARPWRSNTDNALYRAAGAALEQTFGVPPVLAAHGGTLPIAPEFEDVLNANVVVMGFALPGANMHAPDEWFPEAHVGLGMKAMVRLYEQLGGQAPS